MTSGYRAPSVELPDSTKGKAMKAPRTKGFGPARIVALALISLTTLALAYLHFIGGDNAVSVPSGAHAGQLNLHSCHYATENDSYRADCGTLGEVGCSDLPPGRRHRHKQHEVRQGEPVRG